MRVIPATLNAFTHEMNDIRSEELHFWRQRLDSSYWLVHYSNLYAYGRTSASSEPACHVRSPPSKAPSALSASRLQFA